MSLHKKLTCLFVLDMCLADTSSAAVETGGRTFRETEWNESGHNRVYDKEAKKCAVISTVRPLSIHGVRPVR
jgi:hypothetical protein